MEQKEAIWMELRQLEYFQMASRLRNITRAAERLRVSQPNITVAIKKLEAELGIQQLWIPAFAESRLIYETVSMIFLIIFGYTIIYASKVWYNGIK